ncbi:MAK10-like protein, partial [Tanacetum coccineum]
MGDENPIRTLGDYSKPSYEDYRNTIELPEGNTVVPFRSDTIRLVQNGCSFHGLRFEDPNQHLKDFLKLVDSLDLNGNNRERMRLDLIQFSLRDQCEINRAADGKLRDKNTDESWEIIENLALYDHERWNDSKDFVKPVKAVSTPQSISKIPDRRLLELEDQINFLVKGAPEKVLTREEAKSPITKNVNYISLTTGEEEKSDKDDVATGNDIKKINGSNAEMPVKEAETKNGAENRIKNEPIKRDEKEEAVEAPIRVRKIKGKTYNLSHRGPIYEAIPKKKITKKEDIGGNVEIPCNIGGLKRINALVDQGSDMNIMPLSTYVKLTDEIPIETDIRLFLAIHSYIYPLGIADDVLVDVTGYVYLMDFVILDIKEDEKRPFILGTPFLIMAKGVIKFDKGTITLRSKKSKISFHRIPESLYKVEKGIKNDIEHIVTP